MLTDYPAASIDPKLQEAETCTRMCTRQHSGTEKAQRRQCGFCPKQEKTSSQKALSNKKQDISRMSIRQVQSAFYPRPRWDRGTATLLYDVTQ